MPNEHCQSVKDRLGAYATDALNESERADVEAHLASCPDCAAQVERLRRAAASLAPLRDEISERKLSAERRRQILAGESRKAPFYRRHWLRGFAHRPALRWAAAAGIAALAGLAAVFWPSPSRDATQMAAREVTDSTEGAASEIVSESETWQRTKEMPKSDDDLPADTEAALKADVPPLDAPERASAPQPSPASKPSAPPPNRSDAPRDLSLQFATSADSAKSGPGRTGEREAKLAEARRAPEREEMAEQMTEGMREETSKDFKKERAPAPRKQRPESARRVREEFYDRLAPGGVAQAQLADVVTAPSPFRDRHVLLGVRAARSLDEDEISAEADPIEETPSDPKFDYGSASWATLGIDGGAKRIEAPDTKQQVPRGEPETMPVRIRFNKQNVSSQRQIADRSTREGGKSKRSADFDAVYEIALGPKGEELNVDDETKIAKQLNVATLEVVSPRQPLTQQVNVATQLQVSQSASQLNQTAQAHPELYLDACENELERLADKPGGDSKNGEQPVLLRIQAILQAVAEVRPEDPRTQTLIGRVKRQLVPGEPAANPAKR